MAITTRSVARSLSSSRSSVPPKKKTHASGGKKKDDAESTAPTTASRSTTTTVTPSSFTPCSTISRCDAPTARASNKKTAASAPKARSVGGLSSLTTSGHGKGKNTMATGTALSVAASSKTNKHRGDGGNKEATKIKAAPIEIVDLTTDSPPVVAATVQNTKKKKNKKHPEPTKKGEVNIMPNFINLTINDSGAKSCWVEKKSGIMLSATTKSKKKDNNIAKVDGLDKEFDNSSSNDGESSFELDDAMSHGNLYSTLHHRFEGAKDPSKYCHSIESALSEDFADTQEN